MTEGEPDRDTGMNEPKPTRIYDLQAQLKKTIERLRESHSRVRMLMETIPVGLALTSEEGVIAYASPAFLQLFRCTYDDLSERSLHELIVSKDLSKFLTQARKEAQETIARRHDGSEFPAFVRAAGITEGNAPGLLVVVEDITAKHEVERLRDEFISMITHDLRTPLSSFLAFLNLIREGVFDNRIDVMKEKTFGAEEEISRLIKMLNNLLNLHKFEAGRLTLVQEETLIARIVERSIYSVSSYAENRGVSLQIRHIPPHLMVHADGDYTVQVIVNLLSNAVKFSPRGSEVTIWIEMMDRFVKLVVRDKGRGIPEEFHDRLFNRFEQARLTDARVEGGSGLGLAISKAIVEAQGGQIGVRSEAGSGCEFWFTLPLSTAT